MSPTFTFYHSKNRPLFRPHTMAQLSSCSAVSLPLPLPTWPSWSWSAVLSLSPFSRLCWASMESIGITETQSAWSDLKRTDKSRWRYQYQYQYQYHHHLLSTRSMWKDKERVGQICSSSCGGTTGRFPKTDCYGTQLDQVSVSGTENKKFAIEMKWAPLRCGDGMEWVEG